MPVFYGNQLLDDDQIYLKLTDTTPLNSATFSGVQGQSVFAFDYVRGLIDVKLNGKRLKRSAYTATNGTSVTLATPIASNYDVLTIDGFIIEGSQNAAGNFLSYGGTANAITLTSNNAQPAKSYKDGAQYKFRATASNTGAATISVDGLPAKACKTITGAALASGHIRTDMQSVATYYATGDSFVVFSEVGDAVLRQDLADPDKGAAMVAYDDGTVADKLDKLDEVTSNGYLVESFRLPDVSDSNTIRSAIAWVRQNRARQMTRLVFEHGKQYTIDRTIEMGDVANLTLDLNGATLFRAPWTETTSSLSQDTSVGSSILHLDSIPSNWEVSDILMAYTGSGGIANTGKYLSISSIDRVAKTVTLSGTLGAVGSHTVTVPAGTKIGKQIITFNGEYNVLSENVKIINGTFDGNSANQKNKFWRYSMEVLFYGRNSEVSGCTFKNTQGECISGHGIRVEGNEFFNLSGSCLHTSLHDDLAPESGGSWFINNSVKDVCLDYIANGHSEGAVAFSYGAGNLVVSNNLFDTGYTGVLGAFGPSNDPEHADRWLIVTNNICKNFGGVFGGVATPVYGVILTNNLFVNCGSNSTSMRSLAENTLNQLYGNVFTDEDNNHINAFSKIRSDSVIAGYCPQDSGLAQLVVGTGPVTRDLIGQPFGNPNMLYLGNTNNVVVLDDGGMWVQEFFGPTGFTKLTTLWLDATCTLEHRGNRPEAKFKLGKLTVHLPTESAWLPIFADNTAAASLPNGQMYRTADGTLKIKY